jgi:hypothetical protein
MMQSSVLQHLISSGVVPTTAKSLDVGDCEQVCCLAVLRRRAAMQRDDIYGGTFMVACPLAGSVFGGYGRWFAGTARGACPQSYGHPASRRSPAAD